MTKQLRIFNTAKRIKLGIWGLGRGMSFYNSCRALNFDVVAGCDYNEHMRTNFLKANPGAFVTDNAEEFLKHDFDAVLLATYCPAHADDAIACLRAGKHVLSEVTSFHTMAEGVRLVEEVEKSGKVYNLAENYPFSAANMWLARKWKEGFFGDLMYAEYEYVHECRVLAYVYIDGTPINPGNQAHSWRSWLNFHYYNTHSLGPMMHITGLRPTRVVALPAKITLPAYPMNALDGMGGITPSLINMSNGAVVRNLMGATTNDTHQQRIWGTSAAAEIIDGRLRVRVGASGHGQVLYINPSWDKLGELAAKTGHGGGDFWVLYYFARNILFGEEAPFDIYRACDCTIPGILAYRSAIENGKPYDVPDFRDKKQRDKWRNDNFAQPRFDYKDGLFPKNQDLSLTLNFSRTVRDLMSCATTYRAYRDAKKLFEDMSDPSQLKNSIEALMGRYKLMLESQAMAKKIIDAYPESVGARILRELYEMSEPEVTAKKGFDSCLKRELNSLDKRIASLLKKRSVNKPSDKWNSPFIVRWQISKLLEKPKYTLASITGSFIRKIKAWRDVTADNTGATQFLVNVNSIFGDMDGIVIAKTKIVAPKNGTWDLKVGYDGGARVFWDGKQVINDPVRKNPAVPDRTVVPIKISKGKHEIAVALDTDKGMGWGFYLRFSIPSKMRGKTTEPV